jgi:hypothetical protein
VETSGKLTASRRKLLLSASGEYLTIWYKDEENIVYSTVTAVPSSKLMRKIEGFEPNGCRFAFECGTAYAGLQSEFMCFSGEWSMPRVTVSLPDIGEEGYENLLKIFAINPSTNNRYTSADGARHAISGSRSLVLGKNGLLVYSDNDPDSGEGVTLGASDMPEEELIEAFRQLAEGTAGSVAGDAELCLKSFDYDEKNGEYSAIFTWIVSGAPVFGDGVGEAAIFTAAGGRLISARITLRGFSITDTVVLLLPADRAAFLTSEKGGSELSIAYFYTGDSAEAKWSYRMNHSRKKLPEGRSYGMA